MRLWHQKLLPYLPRQQLLGQHRECAALRGAGWGRPHSTVNYVFKHPPVALIAYHYAVMDEMERRGYHPDPVWRDTNWRGGKLGRSDEKEWNCGPALTDYLMCAEADGCLFYQEHDDAYLEECLENLHSKGIDIEIAEN